MGSDNDGHLVGDLTFGPGFVASGNGEAFHFDGDNDLVYVGDAADLALSHFTIDAWIQTASSSVQTVVHRGPAGVPTQTNYHLFIEQGVGFFQISDGKIVDQIRGVSVIGDDLFHHIAGTFDQSTRELRLYVDGVLEFSKTSTVVAAFSGGLTSQLTIGAMDGSDPPGIDPVNDYAGIIDEVRVFSRPLSADEIRQVFGDGSGGQCKI
ncbi:MAG: LamG domain-containing protein [Gemmatimonadota bacterium]